MVPQVGKGKIVKVTGIKERGRTATLLLRGSNKLVLEEAERSVHDALCVIRCLVAKRALIPGGAAPEMEVEHQLVQWAKTLQVSYPLGSSSLQFPRDQLDIAFVDPLGTGLVNIHSAAQPPTS